MRMMTMTGAGVAAVVLTLATTARADDAKTQTAPETTPSTTSTTTSTTTMPSSTPSATPGMTPGTTTTTSATTDASATPTGTMAPPPTRETTTLYQSVRPNKAYLFTGGGLLLGSYATTAALTGVAANDDRPNVDRDLYIPVVGPWLHLADDAANATNSTTDTLLVAGSGVLQGAGVALIIASFFVPEKVEAATIQAGNVKMNVTPMALGRGGSGIGAVGHF